MNKRKKILQFLFLLIIITEIIAPETRFLDENDNTDDDTTGKTSEFVESETKEEKAKRLCGETQPLKGIKEECFQEEINKSNNEVCCYMTIKYETSEHFECIPINKNLGEIKNKINEYKKNYEGSKSISIDCNSPLLRITLISFLLFLIF